MGRVLRGWEGVPCSAQRNKWGHFMRRPGGLLRRVGFIACEAAVALGFIVTVAAIAKYGL